MKKLLMIVTALVAAGISTQAQTLVLSDSFDTGGVATNDLNYNLATRQAGTAAPINYSVTTNVYGHMLTADGKLNVKSLGNWTSIDLDPLTAELGSSSFNVKWKLQHNSAVADGNWAMFTMLSDTNSNWDYSPMTVNLWNHGFLHMDYGDISNIGGTTNNLRIDMTPGRLSAALGIAAFDPDIEHSYELNAVASSATRGGWGLAVDGTTISAGLPYTYEDSAKKPRWNSTDVTDYTVDDLEFSTVAPPAEKEYLFFEDFNGSDGDNLGWLYGARQTNGTVIAPYDGNYDLFSITNIAGNGKLNDYWPGAFGKLDVDLSSYIVGKDFEFSFKVAINILGGEWTSAYLYDETAADGRADSRLGMYIPGLEQPWACVLYWGTGAGQQIQPIDANWYAGLAGYDKSQEHTFSFVSTEGSGGTNSYELFIDGVEITDSIASGGNAPDSLPYLFDGNQRRIAIVGVMPKDETKGALYDDLYMKVFKGNTYEDWVADDTGLTPGVNDGRTDDPDGDLMDNLLEYALGGDPLVVDAASILPMTDYSVANTLNYVFRRRVDAASRGLTYDVVLNTDGLQLPWVNVGNAFESGTSLVTTEIEAVTNTLDISTIDVGFINLEVTEQ